MLNVTAEGNNVAINESLWGETLCTSQRPKPFQQLHELLVLFLPPIIQPWMNCKMTHTTSEHLEANCFHSDDASLYCTEDTHSVKKQSKQQIH